MGDTHGFIEKVFEADEFSFFRRVLVKLIVCGFCQRQDNHRLNGVIKRKK